MTRTAEHRDWNSGIRRRAARAVLTLVVALALGVLTTQSATAETYKERVLYPFSGLADGGSPTADLIRDAKGNLYGTTWDGGASNAGVVFKVSSKGQEIVLYSFTGGADGANPFAGLILDANGNLYGTTWEGGAVGKGTVFKLSKTGRETVLYSFTGGADGANPFAGLILDANGNLYGTAWDGGASNAGVVFKVNPKDKTETVLYNFTGGADGANPSAGLIWDAKGNLYGTTSYGGAFDNCISGCGVVFKIDTGGKETVLYSFTGQWDGQNPFAGLIRDAKGNLYGTASYAGLVTLCGGNGAYGCGVVFKLSSKGGEETVLYSLLYSFTGGADGRYPSYGSLILDAKGNLYGTTQFGGDLSGCGGNGCGVVFKLSSKGVEETVLHRFTGRRDGGNPESGLLLDSSGNLFGTTFDGGNDSGCGSGYGCGTVFELVRSQPN